MVERTFSFDGGATGVSPDPTNGASGDPGNELGAVALGGGTTGDANGSGSGGDDFTFDPERHIGADRRNADGSFRRKRKRRSGNGGSTTRNHSQTRADYSASVDALSGILMIVHAGIASLTKIEEISIDETESKVLAGALGTVLQEFDIQPDPKAQAIVGLVIAAGSIYGPRLYLYRERTRKQKPTLVPFPNAHDPNIQ